MVILLNFLKFLDTINLSNNICICYFLYDYENKVFILDF